MMSIVKDLNSRGCLKIFDTGHELVTGDCYSNTFEFDKITNSIKTSDTNLCLQYDGDEALVLLKPCDERDIRQKWIYDKKSLSIQHNFESGNKCLTFDSNAVSGVPNIIAKDCDSENLAKWKRFKNKRKEDFEVELLDTSSESASFLEPPICFGISCDLFYWILIACGVVLIVAGILGIIIGTVMYMKAPENSTISVWQKIHDFVTATDRETYPPVEKY
jgi:hypothetical protein